MIADLQQQLGIDSSFFQQFVVFILIFLWLRIVYFAPYLSLIEKREGQSEGLSGDALKLEEDASRLEAEYQGAISSARKRALAEREAILSEARRVAADQVAEARAKAKNRLEQSREAAAREAEAELKGLTGQVGSISSLLVNKLMNTKVGF
jgi:F-type H+-transporting ATPase subunit b